jgi:Tfp pilus assembly pilus retraction ATPase PilT
VIAGKIVQGDLASFSIFDITQTLLSGRKTARVTVESGPRRGFLTFKDGQIVHALDDKLDAGEKAVFTIFGWRRGAFTIDFEAVAGQKNIQTPTDSLLLEIARHLDEAQRDEGENASDAKIAQSVEERLNQTLKSKLTTIFRNVAERAEPARDRYTRQAFDGLLVPLLEMRGSALFLRRGLQPRVKGPEGFVTLKDAIIEEDEVSGFLQALLTERQHASLRDEKEVTILYDGGPLGAFRVGIFEEEGAPTILITPARREIPALGSFGLKAAEEPVGRVTEGLVLVAGPLGSGKTSCLASLVAHHVERRDKFAVLYSSQQLYAFPSSRGVIMRRERPVGGPAFANAIRSALDQGADILAVDPVSEADDLRLLLEVSDTNRLVIAAMQVLSFGDLFAKIDQLSHEAGGERLARLFADLLRAVIALPTRRPGEPAEADVLVIGREEQALLRKRDFGALRVQYAVRRG